MEVEFIRAGISDKGEVMTMMKDFYAIDGYGFDMDQAGKNFEHFVTHENLGRFWLIKFAGDLVGYVIMTFGYSFEYGGRDAFIDELFIKKDYRNQGIGEKVMVFLDKEALGLGVNALHLEVEGKNEKGQRLYRKNGYEDNDRNLLTKRFD